MNFNEIKQFTPDGYYRIDVSVRDFKDTFENFVNKYGLVLNPDFQRGHVWTVDQQTRFVEYTLRGGITQEIRLNHPGWMDSFEGDFVCVDGLQRITAIVAFLNNEIKAFGHYFNEFEWDCTYR